MQVVEVLNPLAREYKSIGTIKKELAELQEELGQAHREVCKINSHRTKNLVTYVHNLKSPY